jgi:hypothetical protein
MGAKVQTFANGGQEEEEQLSDAFAFDTWEILKISLEKRKPGQ